MEVKPFYPLDRTELSACSIYFWPSVKRISENEIQVRLNWVFLWTLLGSKHILFWSKDEGVSREKEVKCLATKKENRAQAGVERDLKMSTHLRSKKLCGIFHPSKLLLPFFRTFFCVGVCKPKCSWREKTCVLNQTLHQHTKLSIEQASSHCDIGHFSS